MSAKHVVLFCLLVAAAMGGTVPTQAHVGDGGQLDGLERLQGEAYTDPDPGCDPADGQHTQKTVHEGESVLFLPHSSCGVTFQDITFNGDAVLTWFRVARNDEDPLVLELRVIVDGQTVGIGTFQGFLSGSEPLLLYAFANATAVPAGTYDIRFEYEVIRGPLWHNLKLDYLQWDVENPCQNTAPQAGTAVADGAGREKRLGWQDHVYIFSLAHYVESEGDPVQFEWAWDDGVVQYGDIVVRAFAEARAYTATITATDDPVWRCITGTPKTSQFATSFTSVADDWEARWDSPQRGFSCLGLSQMQRSSTPFDVVAGQCWMQGSVAVSGAVTNMDVRGRLRLDGRTFFGDIPGSVALRSFIGLTHTTEFHTFDACFGLSNDVYERSFCSDEYLFLNIGR